MNFLDYNSVLFTDVGAELAEFRIVMQEATETSTKTGRAPFPQGWQSGINYQPALAGQTRLSRKTS